MKKIIYTLCILLLFLNSCATRPLSRSKSIKIANQVWIVTGASSGLGRGIALQAGAYKAKVVLASRNATELEKVAREIEASGGQALVIASDVSDSAAMAALISETVAHWGHIDVFVNNAGVTVMGNFWEVPLRDHERVLNVNMKGSFYGSYYAIQQFTRQGYGLLINIVSAESRIPTPYQGAYITAKGGIKNLAIGLRQELRLAGYPQIKVVSVDPFAMNTPIWDHAGNYLGHAPRMSMMDRTIKAVNAVMHAVSNKRNRDMAVGWKTHGAYTVNRVFPRLSYRIAANVVYRHQIKMAPPAPQTTGNLYTPSQHPMVETDIKERMKVEKREYKRKKRAKTVQ